MELWNGFVKIATWISLSCWMDLSKFIHEFLYFALLICQSGYMDLLKSLNGFDKVVLCIPRPLPNQIKLKFDQDFKASWSFCFELKVLKESKYSIPLVRFAFGNVFSQDGGCWMLVQVRLIIAQLGKVRWPRAGNLFNNGWSPKLTSYNIVFTGNI